MFDLFKLHKSEGEQNLWRNGCDECSRQFAVDCFPWDKKKLVKRNCKFLPAWKAALKGLSGEMSKEVPLRALVEQKLATAKLEERKIGKRGVN